MTIFKFYLCLWFACSVCRSLHWKPSWCFWTSSPLPFLVQILPYILRLIFLAGFLIQHQQLTCLFFCSSLECSKVMKCWELQTTILTEAEFLDYNFITNGLQMHSVWVSHQNTLCAVFSRKHSLDEMRKPFLKINKICDHSFHLVLNFPKSELIFRPFCNHRRIARLQQMNI